jgi:N-acyl-D-aspartate/D-glutamate deacylase
MKGFGCLLVAATVLVAPVAPVSAAARPIIADLIIRGGMLFDGSDRPAYTGDVAIKGDRIVFVGPSAGGRVVATRSIDARGQIIAPGFIDPHTHPGDMVSATDPATRRIAPWLAQGVTTIVTGIDGGGAADVQAQFARLAGQPTGPNIASYVGFGAVRSAVIGAAARPPTADELVQMRTLVADAMCGGALGLSAGLFYAPQSFAKTDEVIALAREAGVRGGLYDTHQRDESSYGIGLLASVSEAIAIGASAAMPVHFAHLKALGVDVHGQAPAVIALIDAARARGQDVTADQYPWAASGSNLISALLPERAQADGLPAIRARIDDPAQAGWLRAGIADNLRRRGGAESILMTSAGQPWTGKRLSELAVQWQVDAIDAALRIIRSNPQDISIASFNMIDADIDLLMQQPWMMTGSDGSAGHPRMYATFPEKYARYVVERGVISLGTFIRQSTGRTADSLKIAERGYLRPGYFADVLVFDPVRYAPRADYVRPRELSVGVTTLLVNGVPVISDGIMGTALPGRPLPRRAVPGCTG